MRIIALSSVPSFLMGCSPTNLGQVIPCIGCPRLRFRLERAGDSLDNEGSWEELSVSGQPNNRKEKKKIGFVIDETAWHGERRHTDIQDESGREKLLHGPVRLVFELSGLLRRELWGCN